MEGQTFQGVGLIWSILRRHVPENIHTKIKGMRALASMDGAVFDVEEAQAQAFEDAFEHAKESGRQLNFTVGKCKALPDLLDMD